MVKIKGGPKIVAKLRNSGDDAIELVQAVLFEAGQKVQTDAQKSITEGAVSGAGHKPSAPGTAPNNDTGVLASNIETLETGPLKVTVSSNAPYARIQEFGGTIQHPGGTAYFPNGSGGVTFVSNEAVDGVLGRNLPRTKAHPITLPPRPYMGPALQKNKQRILDRVVAAINQANRMDGGKKTS